MRSCRALLLVAALAALGLPACSGDDAGRADDDLAAVRKALAALEAQGPTSVSVALEHDERGEVRSGSLTGVVDVAAATAHLTPTPGDAGAVRRERYEADGVVTVRSMLPSATTPWTRIDVPAFDELTARGELTALEAATSSSIPVLVLIGREPSPLTAAALVRAAEHAVAGTAQDGRRSFRVTVPALGAAAALGATLASSAVLACRTGLDLLVEVTGGRLTQVTWTTDHGAVVSSAVATFGAARAPVPPAPDTPGDTTVLSPPSAWALTGEPTELPCTTDPDAAGVPLDRRACAPDATGEAVLDRRPGWTELARRADLMPASPGGAWLAVRALPPLAGDFDPGAGLVVAGVVRTTEGADGTWSKTYQLLPGGEPLDADVSDATEAGPVLLAAVLVAGSWGAIATAASDCRYEAVTVGTSVGSAPLLPAAVN